MRPRSVGLSLKACFHKDVVGQALRDKSEIQDDSMDLCQTLLTAGHLTLAQVSQVRDPTQILSLPENSEHEDLPEQFQLLGEIGRGGMGVVKLAQHRASKAKVAVKFLTTGNLTIEDVRRFEREAKTLAQFQHNNIIGIKEFGHFRGRPYFSMEYVEGQDLTGKVKQHILETGQVPDFEWTRQIFISLVKALQHCHENEVLHRDLKPHNILIEQASGRPVFIDFGLAGHLKGRQRSSEELTKSGQASNHLLLCGRF
jgi:serine/threonine protein kinase